MENKLFALHVVLQIVPTTKPFVQGIKMKMGVTPLILALHHLQKLVMMDNDVLPIVQLFAKKAKLISKAGLIHTLDVKWKILVHLLIEVVAPLKHLQHVDLTIYIAQEHPRILVVTRKIYVFLQAQILVMMELNALKIALCIV